MGLFETISILITLAALFSYVNCRFIRLPTTIGVMLISLGTSLAMVAIGTVEPHIHSQARTLVGGIDFNQALLHGMLAFLLFAGSLHLDLSDLAREWDAITLLSIAGTVASTLLVGLFCWLIFRWLGLGVSAIWCLLLGALISPTDPIAVLAIMRKVHASKAMETVLAGESLFNDGVGVVLFLTVQGLVTQGIESPAWGPMLLMLGWQVIGGVIVGLLAGTFIYRLLLSVDNYQVEVLLTLALAAGGYTLAEALRVSAPIAVVVAGLFIGNRGRMFAMSSVTEKHLYTFWELVDELLNVLLFLMIGLQVLVIPFYRQFIWASIASVAAILLARWMSVAGSVAIMRLWRPFERGTVTVLTWGGLRGGLSVAMALSLPMRSRHRELIVVITYSVVVFSVFVQGLSVSAVIRRAAGAGRS